MSTKFLDNLLGSIVQPPKPDYVIEWEKRQKKYYQRLRRLCKKHNLTYSRDCSYWDFSKPIGTIGLNEGVECYQSAYEYVFKKINKET